MSKVRLCTVQEESALPFIIKGCYRPKILKGYAYTDSNYSKAYFDILKKLSVKTGKYFNGEDSCIWAWYQNPFLKNHINLLNYDKSLVAITFEIDESEVVFSDFDKWCARVFEGIDTDVIVDYGSIKSNQCIQAVCWGIPRGSIISVESFEDYKRKYEILSVA